MKNHIFSIIKDLKLPSGNFVVTGSAGMAVRGMRSFQDIDITVTEDVYQMLKEDRKWQVVERPKGFEVVVIDVGGVKVEANPYMHTWYEYKPDIKELFQCAEEIHNILFMNLEHLIAFKKERMLEKDKDDLVFLEEYRKREVK